MPAKPRSYPDWRAKVSRRRSAAVGGEDKPVINLCTAELRILLPLREKVAADGGRMEGFAPSSG
jgi:hypothetical protein